jgi:hypothetical protein
MNSVQADTSDRFMNNRPGMKATHCRDISILNGYQMASKSEGCDMYVLLTTRKNQYP